MQSVMLCVRQRNFNIAVVRKISNINYLNDPKPRVLKYVSSKSRICSNLCINSVPKCINKGYSSSAPDDLVDANTFEKVCEETLDSLAEYFDELIESEDKLASADVTYSDGVLTVNLGKYGTYVINRQSPNRQIWLSSPFSGPKRYDFIVEKGLWIYKHDNRTLFELLEREVSHICGKKVDFNSCSYR